MPTVTQDQVLAALAKVNEPELVRDLVSLNMIKDLSIQGEHVSFTVALATHTAKREQIEEEARQAVLALEGVEQVDIEFDVTVPVDARLMGKMNIGVRNAIAVASGKGGVGKSTVAVNLALSLALDGARVGLLDADIYGPNVPTMMGVNQRPRAGGPSDKIIPPKGHCGVKLMSMGFLVDPKEAVIWRGPMIHNALRQFLQDVDWGDLEYLVVDLPPGTGDASLSLAQSLSLTGAVIVTTPQRVALSDVVRGVQMFEHLSVPVLGVVENMSYFVAPDTGKRYDIFGHGGGADMAEELELEFLGEVPLEPEVRIGGDEGQPTVIRQPDSPASQAIRQVSRRIATVVSAQHLLDEDEGQPTLKVI